MRHPVDGTLRRLLDEPDAIADADRAHVATCDVCQAALAGASDDAALASAVFGRPAPADLDVDAAWQRLAGSLAAAPAERAAAATRRRPWRAALRRPAIAGIGAATLLIGAGVAAANDWLEVFRAERVAPFAIDPEALLALPELSAYGEFSIVEEADVRAVGTAEEAASATGLVVPDVADLPQGVIDGPSYHVTGPASAEFTFDAAEAAATLAADGESLPPLPAGLDGSQFRFAAGPGLAAVWEEARGLPALIVARGNAPTGYSNGVAFDTARDYLLALPSVPDDLAAQLRSFSADGATLPIPLVTDGMDSATADVNGVEATVLTLSDGAVSGVVWVDDGIVNVVAGPLGTDEVLAVARGLG